MILDEDPEVKADLQDGDGFTAVHYAAARGDDLMVNLLIDKEWYKTAGVKTNDLETPLHLAAGAKENPALIGLLIKQGGVVDLAIFFLYNPNRPSGK
jgi:ankyrin repeat protein